MSSLPLVLSTVLGLVIFTCILLAVLNYQDDLDALDRFILGGLAGSMLLTTPALWMLTPFDWSFNVSRGFLAAYCVKRFFVPVVWKWRAAHRDKEQVSQSGRRIADRMRHKL